MSASQFRLRDARSEDGDALYRLSRMCLPEEGWTREGLQGELEHAGGLSLVAEGPEGALVGYVIAWQVLDEIHLLQIATDPDWRKQGVGRQLLERLGASGRQAAVIHLEVRISNEGAVRFYEAAGFTRIGRRRDYYVRPKEDALLMARLLRPE